MARKRRKQNKTPEVPRVVDPSPDGASSNGSISGRSPSVANKKMASKEASPAPVQVEKKLSEQPAASQPKKQNKARETNGLPPPQVTAAAALTPQAAPEVPMDVSEAPSVVVPESAEKKRPSSVSEKAAEIIDSPREEDSAATSMVSTEDNSSDVSDGQRERSPSLTKSVDDQNGSESAVDSSAEEPASSTASLKYSYIPGQWAPNNPQGAKAYDKKFLLSVKEDPLAIEIPKNLPNLDIIRPNRTNHDRNSMGIMNSGGGGGNMGMSDFTPPYLRGPPSNREKMNFPSQAHRGSNSMRGNKKMPKIIDAKPTAGKMALKTTENAWAPVAKSGSNVDQKVQILRSLTSILNKICPENYNKLKDTFRDTILKHEQYMTDIIELIFDKAVLEKHFSAEYAALCKYVVDVSAQLPPNQQNPVASKFRKSLLIKCQHEFEKKHKEETTRQQDCENSLKEIAKCTDPERKTVLEKQHEDKFVDKFLLQKEKLQADLRECKDGAKAKMLTDELESLEGSSRRKSVGLIRYVAELFKAHLLTSKIIMGLFITLVKDVHRHDQAEIMCTMFIHIGGALWATLNEAEKAQIRDCVEKIRKHEVIEKESRIKFMLRDAIELFDNGFVAKHRSQQQAGPTTKKGVLEKMSNEQLEFEKQAMASASNNSNRNQGNFRRNDRGSQGRDNMNSESSDRWKTVLSSSSSNKRPQNLRTIGNKNSDNAGENQRLGPGSGFSMWSKGASGGVGGGGMGAAGPNKDMRNSSSNAMPSRGNRFASLPQDDDLPGPETQSRRPMGRGMAPQTIRANPFKGGCEKDDMSGRGSYQDSDPYRDVDRSNSMGRRPASGSSMSGGDPRNKSLSRDILSHHVSQPSSAGAGFYQPRRGSPNPPPREEPNQVVQDDEGEERLRQLCDTIILEFYESKNMEEAITEINDKIGSRNMALFMQVALMHCTEKSPNNGDMAGSLVAEMFTRKHLLLSSIMKVLDPTLEDFADVSLDIPQLATFVAPLFSNLILVDAFALSDVWKMVQSADYQKHKLFLNILKCMSARKDEETYKMWLSSGLKWEVIFKADEGQRPIDIEDELLRYNLSSLSVNEDVTPGEINMSDYHLKMLQRNKTNVSSDAALRDVVKNLVTPKISHSKVNDKVEAEVDDYDALCDRLEALKRYLDLQQPPSADPMPQELSVLYSMQEIAHKLDVPAGLLATLFDAANSVSLVSLESFKVWESSDKEPGQGSCVMSVQAYFRDLRNKNHNE